MLCCCVKGWLLGLNNLLVISIWIGGGGAAVAVVAVADIDKLSRLVGSVLERIGRHGHMFLCYSAAAALGGCGLSGCRASHGTEPAECGRVDLGQTNSISFETICLAIERRSEPRGLSSIMHPPCSCDDDDGR